MGYTIGCRKGRDGRKWHPSVRIAREVCRELKARYAGMAVHRPVEDLCRELSRLGFEPYAAVRDQLFGILRAVNRCRQAAALEIVPWTALWLRRVPVKPFE